MVAIANLETQLAAKIAALTGTETTEDLLILKKACDNTAVDTTALDAAIQLDVNGLTVTNTSEDLLIANRASDLVKGSSLPVAITGNVFGTLGKTGNKVFLDPISGNTYTENHNKLGYPARMYVYYSSTTGKDMSIMTDDGYIFGYYLHYSINSASSSATLSEFIYNPIIGSTTTGVDFQINYPSSGDAIQSKYIHSPIKVAANTWVALATQTYINYGTAVIFKYDPVTKSMAKTKLSLTFSSNYVAHTTFEVVPTMDGYFWILSKSSYNTISQSYRVNLADYTSITVSLAIPLNGELSSYNSTSPVFALPLSDGNIAIRLSTGFDIRNYNGTTLVSTGMSTGGVYMYGYVIVNVGVDRWIAVSYNSNVFTFYEVNYNPATTTITTTSRGIVAYSRSNDSLSSYWDGVYINGRLIVSNGINQIISIKIDLAGSPVSSNDIEVLVDKTNNVMAKGNISLNENGFVHMVAYSRTNNPNTYGIFLPCAFPIGRLIPNNAPVDVGYLDSDSTSGTMNIAITGDHNISSNTLVAGNQYGSSIAISDSLLVDIPRSKSPLTGINWYQNSYKVAGDSASGTQLYNRVSYVFGSTNMGVSSTVELVSSKGGSSGEVSASIAFHGNGATTAAFSLLSVIDGVPFCHGFLSLVANSNTSPSLAVIEYEDVNSFEAYFNSQTYMYAYVKSGVL